MPLPAPNLDDRRFQEIVDEAKRNIALKCPEWTEHNVSDPGVTLIELFAWMTEILLYRLNLVPERNYVKFLEMIGIRLHPGDAARAGVRFPIVPGWPGDRILIPRGTEVSSDPEGDEEPVVFSTDRDLALANPGLAAALAVRGEETSEWGSGPFRVWGEGVPHLEKGNPGENAAFYLGLDRNVAGYLLQADFECTEGAATGLNPQKPIGVWEYFDTAVNEWAELETVDEDPEAGPVERDETRGLYRSGRLLVQVPWDHVDDSPRQLFGRTAWWIRYRYAPERSDYTYDASPEITNVSFRVLAGTVPASHCTLVLHEQLGVSDGTPGQRFRLENAPILAPRPGETLEVGSDDEGWDAWQRVDDFALSGPDDRHYRLETDTGEIQLGPAVRKPDGGVLQAGAVPPAGRQIRFTSYRIGGGTLGNVAPFQLTQLRSAISYISDQPASRLLRLANYERAQGGSDRETLEHACLRGQRKLRSLTRAVTREDYEFHTAQAVPNAVARTYCVTPRYSEPEGARDGGRRSPPPGDVRVLVVPNVTGDPATASPERNLRLTDSTRGAILRHLGERKPLSVRVSVEEPQYYGVATEAVIRVARTHERSRVVAAVRRALALFLNPIAGGPETVRPRQADPHPEDFNPLVLLADGWDQPTIRVRSRTDDMGARESGYTTGWPFGYPVRMVDLRAVIQAVDGVRFLDSVRITCLKPGAKERTRVTGEQLDLPPDALVYSLDHLVRTSE